MKAHRLSLIAHLTFFNAINSQCGLTSGHELPPFTKQNVRRTNSNRTSDFVLTFDLLKLTHMAVSLSYLVYEADPSADVKAVEFQSVQVFHDEPDQAIVVSTKDKQYCFAAFRGTSQSTEDALQNLRPGDQPVCQSVSPSQGSGSSTYVCCRVERGYNEGYNTTYRFAMENALRDCAQNCTYTNKEEKCPQVVLTGHSQGGAIAAAASLYLPDLNPTVVTFGQPRTIDADCPLVDADRMYRFENSRPRRRILLGPSVTYDPVPQLRDRASHYGHQIMLGDDHSGVAYIGYNTNVLFRPWDLRDSFATHRLGEPNGVGYLSRIFALLDWYNATAETSLGIRTTGFRDGTPCTQNIECDSRRCSLFLRRCV
jgi:pimeloyl-ACP methyl ester carboxylesterase